MENAPNQIPPAPDSPTLYAVAAMAANRVIGRQGKMPWHLPEDLQFFKRLTLDHPIIMGRKTWESLGRPLPRRRNIVLSRSLSTASGAEVVGSVGELEALGLSGDVYVIGGAEIYRLLLPKTAGIYITVLENPAEGDTYFPPFETEFPEMEVIDRQPGCEWRLYRRKCDPIRVPPSPVAAD